MNRKLLNIISIISIALMNFISQNPLYGKNIFNKNKDTNIILSNICLSLNISPDIWPRSSSNYKPHTFDMMFLNYMDLAQRKGNISDDNKLTNKVTFSIPEFNKSKTCENNSDNAIVYGHYKLSPGRDELIFKYKILKGGTIKYSRSFNLYLERKWPEGPMDLSKWSYIQDTLYRDIEKNSSFILHDLNNI